MTHAAASRRLHLVVGNPEVLEYGCRAAQVFGPAGGTIGGRGTDWPLSDRAGRIAPLHAEIVGIDGTFCLVDRSGMTRINGAAEPLGMDRIVRLADGDCVQVGPYRLNVHVGDESADAPTSGFHDCSLDDILAAPERTEGAWLDDATGYRVLSEPAVPDDVPVDPLLALDATAMRDRSAEPFDPTHYGLSARQEAPADQADTMVEAFRDRHFLPVARDRESDAVLSPGTDRWDEPVDPGASCSTKASPPICASKAGHAMGRLLRQQSGALIRQQDALLQAIDVALRAVLTRSVDSQGLARGVPQSFGPNLEEVASMFWDACEADYRRRMELPHV